MGDPARGQPRNAAGTPPVPSSHSRPRPGIHGRLAPRLPCFSLNAYTVLMSTSSQDTRDLGAGRSLRWGVLYKGCREAPGAGRRVCPPLSVSQTHLPARRYLLTQQAHLLCAGSFRGLAVTHGSTGRERSAGASGLTGGFGPGLLWALSTAARGQGVTLCLRVAAGWARRAWRGWPLATPLPGLLLVTVAVCPGGLRVAVRVCPDRPFVA